MDSSAKILSKRYARAYMGLDGKKHSAALEAGARAKMEGLRLVFEATRMHKKVLTHPAVSSEVKLEVMAKMLKPGEAGPASDFAGLLVRQGRFGLFEQIIKDSLALSDSFSCLIRAEVHSQYQLSEGELKRIITLLSGPEHRKIALLNVVSGRILGGFEIKVGDTLIDATVRGRLNALRAELTKG